MKTLGEEEIEFKNQKSLFKCVKNISVLNVAFSKSVLVLIKNGYREKEIKNKKRCRLQIE